MILATTPHLYMKNRPSQKFKIEHFFKSLNNRSFESSKHSVVVGPSDISNDIELIKHEFGERMKGQGKVRSMFFFMRK